MNLISKGFVNNSETENHLAQANSIKDSPLLKKYEIQIENSSNKHRLNQNLIIQNCDAAKNEYLTMMNDVHMLLENCENLTNNQKLEYCQSERYYMRLYLEQVLLKYNICPKG
jgi:sugar-specific transcriptional regulator TrmB